MQAYASNNYIADGVPDTDPGRTGGTPEKLVAAVEKFHLPGKVTLYCGNWDLLQRTLAVSKQFHVRPMLRSRGLYS